MKIILSLFFANLILLLFLILFWMTLSEECSMKFQSIALMIQHTF